jgi:hypothetical protein
MRKIDALIIIGILPLIALIVLISPIVHIDHTITRRVSGDPPIGDCVCGCRGRANNGTGSIVYASIYMVHLVRLEHCILMGSVGGSQTVGWELN